MGWTSLHREKGMSDRAFFEQEFPSMLGTNGRILDCASVSNVFYAVVQNNENASYAPNEAWMLVVLMQRTRDWYNFTYKEMSEDMGPCEARCPERLLTLIERLAPQPSEYAAEWRKNCWGNVYATKKAKKVTKGTVVYFKTPITFSNGDEVDKFIFVERSTFKAAPETGYYGRYRITSWRTNHIWDVKPFEREEAVAS